jgi:hypothetical protein
MLLELTTKYMLGIKCEFSGDWWIEKEMKKINEKV